MPTLVNSARSIVLMRADKSNNTLTTKIPVTRAVLFQFVFSIAGAQSFRKQENLIRRLWVISALGKVPTLFGTAINIEL